MSPVLLGFMGSMLIILSGLSLEVEALNWIWDSGSPNRSGAIFWRSAISFPVSCCFLSVTQTRGELRLQVLQLLFDLLLVLRQHFADSCLVRLAQIRVLQILLVLLDLCFAQWIVQNCFCTSRCRFPPAGVPGWSQFRLPAFSRRNKVANPEPRHCLRNAGALRPCHPPKRDLRKSPRACHSSLTFTTVAGSVPGMRATAIASRSSS